ncbi:SCO0607 family lipoprotein [Phytohabitans sp. LJ34]|uniref:SCO0607 family lipoprotein n=1 Tax=Phytohabitans sp. LJ34 TaxID=3452217 RepID=UPI003F8CA168
MDLSIIRRCRVALAAASLPAALLVGGCTFQDAICGSGDYPVQQVGSTGRQCVPEDEEPPAGWTRYPEGKEPRHVDDEWDVYWRTHTIDQSGNIIQSQ